MSRTPPDDMGAHAFAQHVARAAGAIPDRFLVVVIVVDEESAELAMTDSPVGAAAFVVPLALSAARRGPTGHFDPEAS